MGRLPGALGAPMLEPHWQRGLWLGKLATSNENIIGTPSGVIFCRSARAIPQLPEHAEDFKAMVFTPWRMSLEVSEDLAVPTSRSARAPVSHTRAGREASAVQGFAGRRWHTGVLCLRVWRLWTGPQPGLQGSSPTVLG